MWGSRRRDKSFHLLSILLTLLKSCLLFLQHPEKSIQFFYIWFFLSVLPGLTYLLNLFSCVEGFSYCFLYLVVCFLSLVVSHNRHCFIFFSPNLYTLRNVCATKKKNNKIKSIKFLQTNLYIHLLQVDIYFFQKWNFYN